MRVICFMVLMLVAAASGLAAGVPADHPDIAGWADAVASYAPGQAVDSEWQKPEMALGPAGGAVYDVVSLGRSGSIVLEFFTPLVRGPGWDFAVFENSFSEYFLELAWAEVSSDGETFVRFPGVSLTPGPVPAFGAVQPADVAGFAGLYPLGLGTPFDLDALVNDPAVVSGAVDVDQIRYVRLLDIVGDGSEFDSEGRPIYDPYPTTGSAGFDLQAVAVRGEERTDDAGYPSDGEPGGAGGGPAPESSGSAGVGGCSAGSGAGWSLALLAAGAAWLRRRR